MNKKLTLNVDESIIDFAHEYSKKTHQSISNIVENYFIHLKTEIDTSDISSSAKELYGILEMNEIPDKKELRKEFHEKSIN
ncbi:DUF6364 family protein [Spirochaeta lutea]|uniref:Uncharacterized protein n=1 Tax=Spirochaeta lutea TaxID=1480694 RepID=A0A098QWM3_9SPIO|nr:DUF6364 family protein [Spirochaeta lutea]KGE72124.1 hypothetical protein DC28_07755 [Spirochaeta lutea]